MTLQKQAVPINFAQGLDTKTDPFQLNIGSFLALNNSVFTKGKRLTKRAGYGSLAQLPYAASYLTTFNGDLTAIGSNLQAYLAGNNEWINKGDIQPLSLDTLTLIRNNTSQSQADTAIAPNGFITTVYADQNPANLNQLLFKYAVADSITGQNIIPPTVITNADSTIGNPQGYPRVFLLGSYFIVIYVRLIGAIYSLEYIAISVDNPGSVTAPAVITNTVTVSTTIHPPFDAVVFSDKLFVAWAQTGTTRAAFITSTMPGTPIPINVVTLDPAVAGSFFSLTADATTQTIWVSYGGPASAWAIGVNTTLGVVRPKTQIFSTGTLINLTSIASDGILTTVFEVQAFYSYDGAIRTDFIRKNTLNQASGLLGTETTVLRSVGLASKAFIVDGVFYVLTIYVSPYQTTYFLTDLDGNVVAKLAYGNGGTGNAFGYLAQGLPNVNVSGNVAQVSYLFKDAVQAVNKNTNVPPGSQVAGVFSQLGINLAKFTIGTQDLLSSEIGANLNITGGFLWAYDGYVPVEQGFFLYPDSVEATTSTTGGSITAGTYFYQVTYEWTDNQGNAFKSAPSIPIPALGLVTTGATSSNTINVPTLRLTYKTANPVKIVVYRWSLLQQTYYQVTSILLPILNNPLVDSVAIIDTLSDAQILGNNILYTTGGILENIGPPATSALTLFDDRLWLVDAEDKNLLWFSKQVLEQTPVEMSDLLTIFVASTIGSTGPTGPIRALSAMDDKLIIFKQNAIYYINGTGPDATGANNQYSPPTFITSMVGCSNERSIVFQPSGLMFEFASEAGNQIWMLTRDLQTQYIGAPVELLTKTATILSSISVPGTNQVRFNLSSGITLMYDYYYQQWGTFSNNALSSTLFQDLHTYIDPYNATFQESPGKYLDGSVPVVMNFTTSWINVAGLRGYERAYFFFLLGQYITPFKLQCSVAYDYNTGPINFALIEPTNFNPAFGSPEENGQITYYGAETPYGGDSNILNWRVFMKKQRCSAFQITINEVYDPLIGVPAGEGFSLSGLSLVCAVKKDFKTISNTHSVGAS